MQKPEQQKCRLYISYGSSTDRPDGRVQVHIWSGVVNKLAVSTMLGMELIYMCIRKILLFERKIIALGSPSAAIL